MITSIVIEGTPSINMNGSSRITVEQQQLNIKKDIPVIRYRNSMSSLAKVNETLGYAKNIMNDFDKSVHLFEMTLCEELPAMLDAIEASGLSVAKFVYWSVNDVMCDNLDMSISSIMPILVSTMNRIDSFIVYDNTSMLDMNTFKEIVRRLQNTAIGKQESFYGLCNSPFSCTSYACLTAVKARELQGKYCKDFDVPLPTSSHENGNVCSCIRAVTINTDIVGDVTVKKETSSKSSSNTKSAGSSVKKKTIPYGAMF